MEELHQAFSERFQIKPSMQIYEVLLGGYASIGDAEKVVQISSALSAARLKVSARGFSLTIKGFLKNSMADAAWKQILEMQGAGFTVPSFAITQLVRGACDAGRGMEMFRVIRHKVPVSPEATTLLL